MIPKQELASAGVYEYAFVDPKSVECLPELRKYCEENTCKSYGASWACPPAVGTVDECRETLHGFDNMMVFTGKYECDAYDFNSYKEALDDFKDVTDRVEALFETVIGEKLFLTNEGCSRCKACTYPQKACRFPERLHPSMEGFGIWVSSLARQAGVAYNNSPNTVTYFGAALFQGAKPQIV